MIGIIYGSSTGNTEKAAGLIADRISGSEVRNVSAADKEFINSCSSLILGSSTWGAGDLQDDWESGINVLKDCNLSGKKVALFGFGDQEGWADTFVDAMGLIYETVVECGAYVVGKCSTDGYSYSSSIAVIDGEFVGLPLDEDNQPDLTEDRISAWTEKIKDIIQ